MSPSNHYSGERPPPVRLLKVLVGLLVASNLFTGVLSVYLLRNLDSRYNELVRQSTSVMNDLQTVTADAAIAIRRTDPFLFEGLKGEKLAVAVRAAKAAIDEDQVLRTALVKRPWGPSARSRREELAKAGTEFTWLAEKAVELFSEGRFAEAVEVRNKEVRPAFERYIALATAVADTLLEETNRLSDDYSSESKSSSQLMLSIASWPVLLGASLLFATMVFVVSLLMLFRARESAD